MTRAAIALSAALLLALTACGTEKASSGESSSRATTAQLPDLVGENLKDAMASAREAGFDNLVAEDVTGRDRKQGRAVNWQVCTQEPGPAELRPGTKITLGVTKTYQQCEETQPSPPESQEPAGSGG